MRPPLTPPEAPIDPEVAAVAAEHGHDPEQLLATLRQLREHRGNLDRRTLVDLSRALGVRPKAAKGVSSFYTLLSSPPSGKSAIRVCDGVVCWLKGADECRQPLERETKSSSNWAVVANSCLGLCDRAPAALVGHRQVGPITGMSAEDLARSQLAEHPSYATAVAGETRLLLSKVGQIDPQSLDDALAHGAYASLQQALHGPPAAIIDAIDAAGLRGLGGAGFSTGRKWRLVAEAAETPRYVICNADESEPLSFKDRVLMESDPHSVIEGMVLAAYAVGAEQGFIYIRGEYEPQAQILETAIHQATQRGFLGKRIVGTDFSFHLELHRGAGAYICGEETALIESLEGRRGQPRIRPPYPPTFGYHGKPTLVNNVETFAAARAAIVHGPAHVRSLGRGDSCGTKLYTVLGQVRKPGLFEAPLGLTLRQVIDDFGLGMVEGSQFGFALVGGAAGSFVTRDRLDVPLAFRGSSDVIPVGTGGVLVCDDSVSPVAVLRELMRFFERESCGKCTPCRIGTVEARRNLDGLLAGSARAEDLSRLHSLARTLQQTSLCGLGTSCALPICTAMESFPEAFAESVTS